MDCADWLNQPTNRSWARLGNIRSRALSSNRSGFGSLVDFLNNKMINSVCLLSLTYKYIQVNQVRVGPDYIISWSVESSNNSKPCHFTEYDNFGPFLVIQILLILVTYSNLSRELARLHAKQSISSSVKDGKNTEHKLSLLVHQRRVFLTIRASVLDRSF